MTISYPAHVNIPIGWVTTNKIKTMFLLLCFYYHWRRSGIFIVNFEHILHLVLVFLLLTLNM